MPSDQHLDEAFARGHTDLGTAERAQIQTLLRSDLKDADPLFHRSLAMSVFRWLHHYLATEGLVQDGRVAVDEPEAVYDRCFASGEVVSRLAAPSQRPCDRAGAVQLLEVLREYCLLRGCREKCIRDSTDQLAQLQSLKRGLLPRLTSMAAVTSVDSSHSIGKPSGERLLQFRTPPRLDDVAGSHAFQCLMAQCISDAIWSELVAGEGDDASTTSSNGGRCFPLDTIVDALIIDGHCRTSRRSLLLLRRLRALDIMQVIEAGKESGCADELWVIQPPASEARPKVGTAKSSASLMPQHITDDPKLLALASHLCYLWIGYDMAVGQATSFLATAIKSWADVKNNSFVPSRLEARCLIRYLVACRKMHSTGGSRDVFGWDSRYQYVFNQEVMDDFSAHTSRESSVGDPVSEGQVLDRSSSLTSAQVSSRTSAASQRSWMELRKSVRAVTSAVSKTGKTLAKNSSAPFQIRTTSVKSFPMNSQSSTSPPSPTDAVAKPSSPRSSKLVRGSFSFRKSTPSGGLARPGVESTKLASSCSAADLHSKGHGWGLVHRSLSSTGGESPFKLSAGIGSASDSSDNETFSGPSSLDNSFSSGEVFSSVIQVDASQAADILLRQLHLNGLIKMHRHKLRKYAAKFCCSDVVSWLVSCGSLPSRDDAVCAMTILQANGSITAIGEQRPFKDDDSVFQFDASVSLQPHNRGTSVDSTASIGSLKKRLTHVKSLRVSPKRLQYATVPAWCCPSALLDTDCKQSDPSFHHSVAIYFCFWLNREFHLSQIVRNRRWGLDSTVYPASFVAKEAVTFLVNSKCTDTREDAVMVMETLRDYNLLHHVVKEHHFKDEFLFFRFRSDDHSRGKWNATVSLKESISYLSALNCSVPLAVCSYDLQALVGGYLLLFAGSHCTPVSQHESAAAAAAAAADDDGCCFREEELVDEIVKTSPSYDRVLVVRALQRLNSYGLVRIQPLGHPEGGNEPEAGRPGRSVFFTSQCSLHSLACPYDDGSGDPLQVAAPNGHMACLDGAVVASLVFAVCRSGQATDAEDFGGDVPMAGILQATDIVQGLLAAEANSAMPFESAALMRYLCSRSFVVRSGADFTAFSADEGLYTFRPSPVESVAPLHSVRTAPDGSTTRSVNFARTSHNVIAQISDLSSLIPVPGAASTVNSAVVAALAVLVHKRWKADRIVKDRRYKFKLYPQCFVGKDVVDWLIGQGHATNRLDALAIMRCFEKEGLIGHVCSDHLFCDEFLFYHFKSEAARRGRLVTLPVGDVGSTGQAEKNSHVRRASSDSQRSFEDLLDFNGTVPLPRRRSSVIESIYSGEAADLQSLGHDTLPNLEAVAAAAEFLRVHWHDSAIVRSIRQGIHVYRSVFLGREAVDWLVEEGLATSRGEAITMMGVIFREGFVHHVTDKLEFSDTSTIFRFRTDEAPMAQEKQLHPSKSVDEPTATSDLYHRLCHHSTAVLKKRLYRGRAYPSCVTGQDLVGYLVRFHEDFVNQRPEAVAFCRDLFDSGIISHVHGAHLFKDTGMYYYFAEDPEWADGPLKLSNFMSSKKARSSANPSSSISDDAPGIASSLPGRCPLSSTSTTPLSATPLQRQSKMAIRGPPTLPVVSPTLPAVEMQSPTVSLDATIGDADSDYLSPREIQNLLKAHVADRPPPPLPTSSRRS